MNILKKISISTVNALPKGGFSNIEDKVFVMRIFGMARASEIVVSQYGESFKFKGDFRAHGQDGALNVSSVAFLPAPVDEMLASALSAGDGKPVDFAFDIYAAPHHGERGYQYIVQTLTETAPSEPLVALAASLPPLALPATLSDSETPDAPIAEAEPVLVETKKK